MFDSTPIHLTRRWSQLLAAVPSRFDSMRVSDVCHARRRQQWLSSFSLDLLAVSPSAFTLARLGIIVLGSVFFVLSTFFTRPWPFAVWVKAVFWVLGVAGITWGATKIFVLLHAHSLSPRVYYFLHVQQLVLLAVAFAALALFFISGEAYRGVQRWRDLRKKS